MTTVYESYEKRQKDNATLKSNGYRWKQQDGNWLLLDPLGQVIEKPKALQDIESGNVPKPQPVFSLMDRLAAIRWAQSVINQPNIIVLDTEGSGLGLDATCIEISAVDLNNNVVINTLLNTCCEIESDAMATHGITVDDLQDAPVLYEVWDQLNEILTNHEIIIYNAAYDVRLLRQTAEKHGLVLPPLRTHCLMRQFAMYYGELIAPDKEGCYKNKKQDIACQEFGVSKGTHRALDDTRAAREVLDAMANVKV